MVVSAVGARLRVDGADSSRRRASSSWKLFSNGHIRATRWNRPHALPPGQDRARALRSRRTAHDLGVRRTQLRDGVLVCLANRPYDRQAVDLLPTCGAQDDRHLGYVPDFAKHRHTDHGVGLFASPNIRRVLRGLFCLQPREAGGRAGEELQRFTCPSRRWASALQTATTNRIGRYRPAALRLASFRRLAQSLICAAPGFGSVMREAMALRPSTTSWISRPRPRFARLASYRERCFVNSHADVRP